METISALLALCAGNSPVPVNSPHKGQWRGALMFTLICARINGWVNNREAGDLRRYRAHYDVIVMLIVLVLDKSCGHNGDFSFVQQAWNRGQCVVISPKTSWYGAILHISAQYLTTSCALQMYTQASGTFCNWDHSCKIILLQSHYVSILQSVLKIRTLCHAQDL